MLARPGSLARSLTCSLAHSLSRRALLVLQVKLLWAGRNVDPSDGTVTFPGGSKVTCILTSKVTTDRIAAARSPNDRAPSLEYELEREAKRASNSGPESATSTSSKTNSRIGRLATFEYPAEIRATLMPTAAEAEALLKRVADDRGIVFVMSRMKMEVGVLSELPPDGYVGVSPVCVLGLNMNRGAEIKLRLRTDDMLGFRKVQSIIDTMLHELAHNVYDDHGEDFRKLNSQLRADYMEFTAKHGWTIAGTGSVRERHPLNEVVALTPDEPSSRYKQQQGGRVGALGTTRGAGRTERRQQEERPAAAAALAALDRATAHVSMQSFPILAEFAEKEHVVYYDRRNGEYVDAVITSVDRTIQPHSYTVDLYERGLDEPPTIVGRETEASRLSKKESS